MDSDQPSGEAEFAISPITTSEIDSISEVSAPSVHHWHQLISTTNWKKGEVICRWRQQLKDAGTAPRLYSDPAWSRLVGEISAQHVGRLRRTFERFGAVYSDYKGLFWSHFYAALDWQDAEMWLEGAVQNRWTVAKMRFQRWETLGAVAENRPRAVDIISSPDDEGILLPLANSAGDKVIHMDEGQTIVGPILEGPDFGDEDSGDAIPQTKGKKQSEAQRVDIDEVLGRLPKDVAKSFSAFRQCIERLKQDEWNTVKRIDIVALINDLRQLLRTQPKTQASQQEQTESEV